MFPHSNLCKPLVKCKFPTSQINFQIARWWTRYYMRRLDDLFCELVGLWPFFCGAIWTNCNHPKSFNGGSIYHIDQETYFGIKIILAKKLCQNTCSPWRLSLRMKFSLAGCHPTRKRLPQWFTWKVSNYFLWICLLPTKCIGVSLVLRSGNLLQAPTTGRQPPTRSLAPHSILVGDMVGWPPTPGSRWVSKYALSPHLGHKSEGNWWVQHQGQVLPQPTLAGEAKLLAWACLRQRCLKGQNVLFMGNWNSHLLNWRVLETSVKEYKTAWYRRHLWAMGVPSMWQGWCWNDLPLTGEPLL